MCAITAPVYNLDPMALSTRKGGQGRVHQRNRTRKAIVEAAIAMLRRGETPSMAAVAESAEVSRRTIYMYFPTLDQLLIDATAGVLGGQAVDARLAQPGLEEDAHARVEILARSVQGMSPEVERLGRSLIRRTVEQGGKPRPAGKPLRGYRRVEWIEQALAPLRPRIDKRRYERLVSALAMVIGWEALVVQRDIRALAPAECEELSAWA